MKTTHLIRKCTVIFMVFLLCIQSYACADGFSTDPVAINEKIKSVVMLTIYDSNQQPIATGSGFVAFDNRTLVTNYHVIKGASSIVAESDEGYMYFVTGIIAIDTEKDIAILQFMAPTVMQPLEYSTELPLRGSPIVVIGSPKGLRNTVSTGIISSIYKDTQTWIQFTAPASPGSSGGPVFDDSGKVIGMTTWNVTEGQNLNFALGMDDIIALYQIWDGKTVADIGSANQQKEVASNKTEAKPTDNSGNKKDGGYFGKISVSLKATSVNVEWAGVGKGSTNDEYIVNVKIRNPKNGKTIKAIELCLYFTDVWGSLVGNYVYTSCEKTIRGENSAICEFPFLYSEFNIDNSWRCFHYGISRIAYTDGTVDKFDINEIQFKTRERVTNNGD